ncbi:MAG: SGNH/GDSL hydrolase family protein [Acidobacteriota bacterium]|nr:SGNH/GDSL hydrolase family protein [Acidobacteriota bacterium]
MRRLLFWGLFPFVLPQALYVRKTAPRFAGAGGLDRGSVGTGEVRNLAAIGDSIIAGVGASDFSRALVGRTAQHLASLLGCRIDWQAIGRIGAVSRDVRLDLMSQLPDKELHYILVSVGVNDVTSLTRSALWRRNLADLLNALRERSPGAVIALTGLPPLWGFPLLPRPLRDLLGMRAKQFDEIAIEVVGEIAGAVHVPLDFEPTPDKFAADGYHPCEESYVAFGQTMAEGMAAYSDI